MNNGKKQGLGLFINKKSKAGSSSIPSSFGLPKSKDVRKRWLFVGGGLIGLVVVVATLFGNNRPPPRQPKQKVEGTVAVNPPNADKAAFESRYARDLEQLRADLLRLNAEKDAQGRLLQQLREEQATKAPAAVKTSTASVPPPTGIVAPPALPGANTGGLSQIAPPSPPVPPRAMTKPAVPTAAEPVAIPPAVPALPGEAIGKPVGAPMVFAAPGGTSAKTLGQPDGVGTSVTYEKNRNRGMLPAGAFAKVALLNGLEAGTSSQTQTNPMPILMNVTDNAILPGSARYRIKSCFVLGSGHGDLSSERVYVRFSRLSCIDKSDRLVLSQEVAGYLVDSDGKLGMRGLLINRQGAKLGQSTLAAFAGGLANAFAQSQTTVLSNATDTTQALSTNQTLRIAGLSGAQEATAQLAQFYLKQAQSIFPVISVDAGRVGTIVFTGSVPLEWGSLEGQYVANVKPEND